MRFIGYKIIHVIDMFNDMKCSERVWPERPSYYYMGHNIIWLIYHTALWMINNSIKIKESK